MPIHDLENPQPIAGDMLRDRTANLLAVRFGRGGTERRVEGKKVDIVFKHSDLGRQRTLFVECKDWGHRLTRKEVVSIWSDYSGIVDKYKPADLLIVTSLGVTTDAQKYIEDEIANLRHQTIWQLENDILGLTDYTRSLAKLDTSDGLSEYYVPQVCAQTIYDPDNPLEVVVADEILLISAANQWLLGKSATPMAVLGSYGAGKTSFARTWVSQLAKTALEDSTARIPIYIKLGSFVSYSAIESVLSKMFGAEFPIIGFSVPTFLDCSERGRFVIVCDGFDEMKHAMSWADFRGMVTEILKLNRGDAKLMIIGRPSAFITDDEHFHVLRGHKKIGDHYRRLPDWPQFSEYSVCAFDKKQRESFIRQFIQFRAGQQGSSATIIVDRIERVIALADADVELFSKPVHAKILTELGASSTFDLVSLPSSITRWDLYEAFFLALHERELAKEARRPFDEKERMKFLEEVAYWLWTEKDGRQSFSADEIPSAVLIDLYEGDADDGNTKLREYLTGAFLERKQSDIYFFGHRSFLEFLVASRMLRVPPESADHHWYARSLHLGPVRDFFLEGRKGKSLNPWVDQLTDFRGDFDLAYLRFIRKYSRSFREIRRSLPERSNLSQLFRLFDDSGEIDVATERKLISSLSRGTHQYALLALEMLLVRFSAREIGKDSVDKSLLSLLAQELWNLQTYFPGAIKLNTFAKTYVVDGSLLRKLVEDQASKAPMRIIDSDAKVISIGFPKVFSGPSTIAFSRIIARQFRP